MASKNGRRRTVKRETICAIASARGEGAVGVLRISGPDARDLLERASGKRAKARRMQRRVLREPIGQGRVDEVLVCWMPGPHSYTGEDVVEIFGHGGEVNMRGLLEFFCGMGAREARPGEFTRRAFLEGRLDLTQAEAVAEIIEAKSERALENAQALLAGKLGSRVRRFRNATLNIAAELEAAIDFAEEEGFGEEAGFGRNREALIEDLEGIREPLGRLIERARDAVRLEGISVAFVGPVNVGKSSLFNAMVDEKRALVSGEAGTTRDYLEADVTWGGIRVRLVDTAGERLAENMSALEREGRRLAEERIARCDVIVRLVDGTAGGEKPFGKVGSDWEEAQARSGRVVIALTKGDEVSEKARETWAAVMRAKDLDGVWTSAVTKEGLDVLLERVVRSAFPEEREGGDETIVVTQRRQVRALKRAAQALGSTREELERGLAPELCVESLREALEAFGEVTGESYREDVLDAVFARFCIGK